MVYHRGHHCHVFTDCGHIQGYADDTIHFVEANSEEEAKFKLEQQAKNIFDYFASNELVANPSKTAFLMFRPGKSNGAPSSVRIDNTEIQESRSERILGIQVQSSLLWDDHISKVTSKVNYGLATVRQLRGLMTKKALTMIAEGIVLSHICYGISVYLNEGVRMNESDSTNKNMQKLQVKQNDCMRLILNKNRKDLVTKEELLQGCNFTSVNHMAASATLMEVWRAFKFNIKSITSEFNFNQSQRHGCSLRPSTDPKSFISKSSKLWNRLNKDTHTKLKSP